MSSAAPSARRYCGTTCLLRAGDVVALSSDCAVTSEDPATALAGAWPMAEARGGIAHLYVAEIEGGNIRVIADVQVDGALAYRAGASFEAG